MARWGNGRRPPPPHTKNTAVPLHFPLAPHCRVRPFCIPHISRQQWYAGKQGLDCSGVVFAGCCGRRHRRATPVLRNVHAGIIRPYPPQPIARPQCGEKVRKVKGESGFGHRITDYGSRIMNDETQAFQKFAEDDGGGPPHHVAFHVEIGYGQAVALPFNDPFAAAVWVQQIAERRLQ